MNAASKSLLVRPIRFTDRIEAMKGFYELLGLRSRIESERGGWVDMVAGAGMVALHSAATSDSGAVAGETRLSFEADELAPLAERLQSAGVADVTVYDEAYGKALRCRDPLGDEIVVDAQSSDLYGYRLHAGAEPDLRVTVMPVRFTAPRGPYVGFLRAFGFARTCPDDEHYVLWAGPGRTGQIGLHHVYPGDLPILPGPAAVQLTFETSEPLHEVADRLSRAGFADARVDTDDFGVLLSVTDPDGRECQLHEPAGDG